MNPHHWYSSSTHSDERLVFQPGTSHLDAKLEPLPDSSCSDEDDWIKPNSVLRGNITHLAAQGVDLPRSGLTTREIDVTKGEGTSSSMYPEPGDGRLSGQRHGAAVSAWQKFRERTALRGACLQICEVAYYTFVTFFNCPVVSWLLFKRLTLR